LLERGQQRELRTPRNRIITVRAYTVPEAARALGKSELTFKRWIAERMIPEAILVDTVRGYRHYTEIELNSIAIVLRRHEREFSYYAKQHRQTRGAIVHQVTNARMNAGYY
jgi:hypothetical protein